jgi:DNA-binding NtrC family response regulator
MQIAAKPARKAMATAGKILYAEHDAGVLAEQSQLFERAGYAVELAQGRKAAEQALRNHH